MTYITKPLADGQLPNSKGTLYTVPAATATNVRQMRISNVSGGTQTVTVYLNVTGTSRRVGRFVLSADQFADVFSEPVQLAAGDLLEGDATSAASVDYVIYGVEDA